MFDDMEWERVSNDQIDEALDHFGGLASASLARVCELIREVDCRQSWIADGARTLVDWVAARLRVRHASAARLVGVARRLAELPVLSARFASGEVSLDQVDALSRMATPETEAGLIEEATGLTNTALDRAARRHHGISEDDARTTWERRRLVRQWNLDESELRFHGNLPGDAGRIFDEAIDIRIEDLPPNPETGAFDPHQIRAADALTELAATAGGAETGPNQLTVFADLESLTTKGEGGAELDNGAVIPNETARRLGCDAVVRTVIRNGKQVIGIGRAGRKIPGWLRDLVYQRDGYLCQHPGCGNTRWLQIHHIVPWALGGPTDLENLILLCGYHHRFHHEQGWRITGSPDCRVFRRPDWTPYPGTRHQLHPRLLALVRST